jgi:hypothetical protein
MIRAISMCRIGGRRRSFALELSAAMRAGVWLAFVLAPGCGARADDEMGPPPPTLRTPAPTPAPGFATGPATPMVFTARGGRELLLQVPAAWDAKGGPGPQGTIRVDLAPKAGRAFSMQITAIPLTPAETARLQGDGLRNLVRLEGERMLDEARETAIRTEPVLGGFGRGYLYTITDPRPVLPRWEWRYLTGGAYLVGETLLSVSLLTNEGVGAVRMQANDLLRSAQVQSGL